MASTVGLTEPLRRIRHRSPPKTSDNGVAASIKNQDVFIWITSQKTPCATTSFAIAELPINEVL